MVSFKKLTIIYGKQGSGKTSEAVKMNKNNDYIILDEVLPSDLPSLLKSDFGSSNVILIVQT